MKIDKLSYPGTDSVEATEEYEAVVGVKLNDENVFELSEALKKNNTFRGPLDLSKNELTDLSALYLKESLGEIGKTNITKLNLSDNPGMKTKTGIYIGDALVTNKD